MYFEVPETNLRVLGSMHMVPVGEEALPAWARSAYDWCENLVIEGDSASFFQFTKTEADSLQGQLPPHVWQALQPIWPSDGPLAPLAKLRPWAALLFLGAIRAREWMAPGIEPTLLQLAASQGKPVGYLETAEGVAQLFGSAPLNEIQASFDVALGDEDGMRRLAGAMYEAWQRQDRDDFFVVASKSPMLAFSGIRRAVLDARNLAWVPELERLLASPHRTLVVVGALHLCGPGNIEQCLGRRFMPVRPQ